MMVRKMKAIRIIVARFRRYKLRRYLFNLIDLLKYVYHTYMYILQYSQPCQYHQSMLTTVLLSWYLAIIVVQNFFYRYKMQSVYVVTYMHVGFNISKIRNSNLPLPPLQYSVVFIPHIHVGRHYTDTIQYIIYSIRHIV